MAGSEDSNEAQAWSARQIRTLSQEFLRRAHELAGIGTFLIDLNRRTINLSPEMAWLLRAGSEALTLPLEEYRQRFYHPEDRAPSQAKAENAYANGGTLRLESRVLRGDGEIIWVRAVSSVERDEHGDPIVIGVLMDVTQERAAEVARHRAAERLLDSETRFRVLCDNALAGIYVVQAGRLVYVNRSFERIFGYSSGELLGADPLVVIHPEDRERVALSLRERLPGPADNALQEARGKKKNGDQITIEVLGTGVDLEGRRAVIGTVLDITERKRVQSDLERSEQRFRTLIEQAPVAIGISRHGVGIYSNRKFLELWGYESSDAIIGKSIADHWKAGEGAEIAERARRRSMGLPAPSSYAGTARRADGSEFPAHSEVVIVDLPDGPANIAFISDITERVRTEDALRESERRFREIAESIDELFWVTDPLENRFLYVSPAYSKIWGKAPELDQLADTWLASVHEEDRERVRDAAALQARGGYDETYRIIRPDGTTRWIRERAFPLRDSRGQVHRIVGTALDVTEQQNLQAQLLQSQKMEAIGVLAGGVAHDFNNVLAVILSYTSLLIPELNPREPMREDLLEIQAAAERAIGLTRQLLAFSRRQVFQLMVVDLNSVMAGTEKMLRRLIGEDIQLRTLPHPDGAYALVDTGQIEQVLLNLVVNSRDAMPEGGTITIEIGDTEVSESDAARWSLAAGPHVSIRVSDTGIGMDAATQARIFEPFFTTKDLGKGTGLGLATVFGIVKQSRGHITVESEPGNGTTFCIWLPRASPEDHQGSRAGVETQLHGSETILVVEDDESVRRLTRAILAKKGYRVLEAQSGGDALLICERHPGPIDLVLTDIVMPMMNGEELFARLTAIRPGLRVLYMSGYPQGSDAVLGSRVQEAFIAKPFVPARLLQRVREILASRRAT